jgi:hypothetical protein
MNQLPSEQLIEALSDLHVLFPEWRMGQLVANLVAAAGGMDAGAIWDMEDAQLLAAAHRLIEGNRGRQAVSAEPDAEAGFGPKPSPGFTAPQPN